MELWENGKGIFMNTNERKLYHFILLVFVVISLPIYILSFYNVPSADDYMFGQLVKAWVSQNGYNIWGILKCGVKNSIKYYFSWQGRYSESFFASFMPDIFGGYWMWTIFLYSFFVGGVVFLFYTIVQNLAGREYVKVGICIGVIISIAITQNVPFPVEAFFWFDGSMAYMFHHALYIWMCGMNIKYFFIEEKKTSIRCIIISSILTVLVAGGNNVTSFVCILTYCIFLGIVILIRKKHGIFFPFVLSVCGFLISYLSPGTMIRGGDSSNYTPILVTIKKCFVWTIKQYFIKWSTFGIILMCVFLTPLLLKIVLRVISKYNFKFPVPFLVIIGYVCIISAMSSPSFYILGEPGPGRLKNIIFVNYILFLIIVYCYVLGWVTIKWKNMQMMIKISRLYQGLSMKISICLVSVMFIFLCVGNFQQYGISIEAIKELESGQAVQYYEEAMDRKELYQNLDIQVVEVLPYSIKPYLLFFDDITDDSENWKNKAVSQFYGKDSIKLNRYDPDVDYD